MQVTLRAMGIRGTKYFEVGGARKELSRGDRPIVYRLSIASQLFPLTLCDE